MPWIERFGDLAAETGLSLHAETTNRAPGNNDWSKMKKKKFRRKQLFITICYESTAPGLQISQTRNLTLCNFALMTEYYVSRSTTKR